MVVSTTYGACGDGVPIVQTQCQTSYWDRTQEGWAVFNICQEQSNLRRDQSPCFGKVGGYNKKRQLNWSRAVLLNWLSTDWHERQGKAITNFNASLPEPQGDLAQEITKDPYHFDFLSMREGYDEKELKDVLENNKGKDNVLVQYALESTSAYFLRPV